MRQNQTPSSLKEGGLVEQKNADIYNVKFFFCFSFLFLVASAEATFEAKSDWQYNAFPFLPKNIPQKKNEPEVLKIGKTPLHALMSRQSGTHVRWGVEQVYLSKNLKKKVFVKYNVSLSSAAPIGGWLRLKKGQVLHLRKGKSIVAYMAQGFNNRELYELQMQLRDQPKVTEWNPFINCAHAEVVTSPDGSVYYDTEQNTARAAPAASSSWLSRAGSISLCVGAETLEASKESARQLWENASLGGFASGAQAAASAAWQAIPSREEIRSGWNATTEFVSTAWNQPEQAWSDVVDGFDRSLQAIARIAEKIADSVEGFFDLSEEIQNRLVCDGVTFFAQRRALSAVMVMTGAGTAAAIALITSTALQYADRIKPIIHILRVLNVSDFDSSEKMQQVEALLKGSMSQQEQQSLLERHGDFLSTAAATTATPSVASRLAAVRNMSEAERTAMLQASSRLDTPGRVRAAEAALGRNLTPKQRLALEEAHEIGYPRGFGTYTPRDLLEKRRALGRAGIEGPEAELLLRQGIAGQYVSGSVTFAAPGGALASTGGNVFAATTNPNFTLMKLTTPAEFTQARTFFNNRAQDALKNNRTSYARSDFLSAGNHEGYIETFISPRPDGGYRMVDSAEARAAIAQLQREIKSVSITDAGRVNIPTTGLTTERFTQGEALYSNEYVSHYQGVRQRAIKELQEWLSTADSP